MGWGRGAFFAPRGPDSQEEPRREKSAPSPLRARGKKGTGRIFASPHSALPIRAGENAPRPLAAKNPEVTLQSDRTASNSSCGISGRSRRPFSRKSPSR